MITPFKFYFARYLLSRPWGYSILPIANHKNEWLGFVTYIPGKFGNVGWNHLCSHGI